LVSSSMGLLRDSKTRFQTTKQVVCGALGLLNVL
jgi:hypothetical protein